ncbi:DUF5605 domain-containing protein [Echinicola jeungdonensis]|uniref:DUF5605 domain-containing protein n=1 Tax=Echinicola jeungdonensis TaxID=709343 RepID=A0ABV5J3T2_9BACT|nr:DUF5605 domain-containing protein [Echinicola jeungdonensis]MDN3669341.1 DUF5605 domain-containing protein [Echinicola jeungdonensis]
MRLAIKFNKIFLTSFCLAQLYFLTGNSVVGQTSVPQWDLFELILEGPEGGNPFIGTEFGAVFYNDNDSLWTEGFYDGNGEYKIRFMPEEQGEWTYKTFSNKPSLDGKEGKLICTEAKRGTHGPVMVRDQYHFQYPDGTPFYPFGTTVYEWPFQSMESQLKTLETLKSSPFNKVRFLAVPPYKERYIEEGKLKIEEFPFEGTSRENWDFSRFNPEYFKKLDQCVKWLYENGIQADLILFRPYDDGRWGFDEMDQETNKRFVSYMMARYAAFSNIWWSLANENSFMKSLTDEEWDELFQLVEEKDSYGHLRSIHNAGNIYDYGKPWVSHISLQYYNAVRVPGVSPLLRDLFRKPVVHDEINYEGNITRRWGRISAEELTFRFWNAYIGGGYATHGESYKKNPWISTGGKLIGESPERIAFLKSLVQESPVDWNPVDQYYELNLTGKGGEFYMFYFGKESPSSWKVILPKRGLEEGDRFKVEIIDTWNMTIDPVEGIFEMVPLEGDGYKFRDKDGREIQLPGKPYLALRIKKVAEKPFYP